MMGYVNTVIRQIEITNSAFLVVMSILHHVCVRLKHTDHCNSAIKTYRSLHVCKQEYMFAHTSMFALKEILYITINKQSKVYQ